MIEFSNTVKEIIADGKAEAFFCVYILNNDSSVFRASTSHTNNVTLSNGITYVADDFLVNVEPPQQSSNVDREKYKITVCDSTFQSAALAENGLVGKRIEIRLGFMNPDTGLPLTSLSDTIIAYKGRLESLTGEINTEEVGEIQFVFTCTSPIMSLDMTRGIYMSKDYIRGRNPNDACADEIYVGNTPLLQKWGRK
jgi:hypothetical protein